MDDNARNLLYFESGTMAGLYADMEAWQHEKEKRLLSLAIQKDGDKFCCIALTNPSEVLICGPFHSSDNDKAHVSKGALHVRTG